jgi:gluconolactonase
MTLPLDASYDILDPTFTGFLDTETPPEVIASGYTWTEGPVWLKGGLYFNDIPAKRMWHWTESGGARVALENSEFANGNTLDMSGHMVSCEHGGRRVVRRLDPEDLTAVEVVAERWQGKRLNSPNDVVVRRDGTVWFTDPPYGINSDVEGYPAESEIGSNNVYCVTADGAIIPVATDFDKPNGLAFSPDESKLYIADSGAIQGASFPGIDYDRPHHIRVFDVKGTTLSGGTVFAEIHPGVPDGLRVDHEGYIWTSSMDGIRCLSPEGRLLGRIVLPAPTANICFGGGDGTDMFITASDKVWRVRSTRRDATGMRERA